MHFPARDVDTIDADVSTRSSSTTPASLTHLTPSGAARMVSVTHKAPTHRLAVAVATVRFSSPDPVRLLTDRRVPKGDAIAAARIAGIMAAKRTADLVPLCHPLPLTHVGVDLCVVGPAAARGQLADAGTGEARSGEQKGGEGVGAFGGVRIEARVQCTGPTGVEMEALVAASVAALTLYDMCKAVDKRMVIEGCRVVLKQGGKSGDWKEVGWTSLDASDSDADVK